MTRRVRSALRSRRRRSSSPSSQASNAATAPRSSRSSVPRAKRIYIYPGLLRVARHSAIALDARCPASVYKGSEENGHNCTTTCAICLETFHNRDLVRRLPCEHSFHTRCILNWFVSNDRCPLCNDVVSSHPVRQKVNIDNPPTPQQSSSSINNSDDLTCTNPGPRTYSFIVHDDVRMEVDRAAAAAATAATTATVS